ncbi:hypothetical protein C8J29_102544 [Cereibacter johrii]|uniref:Uncharacterized protein n=1 Tax=Cereibacter johrii TaxID=445629 RepID=A0ABX5JEB6_9RHOB|nr:hypothetical protein C8J29_102544 [Cereibacter johrii]
MADPAPAGARVVVLDGALAPLTIAEADIGRPWNWRVGPAARPVMGESYTALAFTPGGRGLVPFAPVHVEQPWRQARSPGDLTIRWVRRSRALVADAWEQVEVPLGEEIEAYEVEILDGAAVRRTLITGTSSVLYSGAQQIADWGAPLGPGQTLVLRIFQLSNRLGRGTPATATLQHADRLGHRHGFGGQRHHRHSDDDRDLWHGHRRYDDGRDQDREPRHRWRVRIDHRRQHRLGHAFD